MNKEIIPHFIAIDDDRIDNMICLKMICKVLPGANVQTFTDPEKGLEYLLLASSHVSQPGIILFLDINMPTLSGWQVLEEINTFPENARKKIKTYILSSSINPEDKKKADNNPLVRSFIQKPLTRARLNAILKDN